MQKQEAKLISLFVRYLIIVLAGLGNLYIFYKIFTPLTIRGIAILTGGTVIDNVVVISNLAMEIIPACVAGSAYYLLFILLMTTPNLKIKERINVLLVTFISLFVLNIIRILILSSAYNTIYFDITHLAFWYFISTIFVVAVWIFSVRKFRIKSIPVYSDLKFLYNLVKPVKNSKRRKKNN